MIFSSNCINFRQKQTHQIIEITNSTTKTYIFKVKITNTDLFSIAPGKGFLKSQQKAVIQIKLIKFTEFKAKLLVSYAQIDTGNNESYQVEWERLSKQNATTITNEIIPIQRSETMTKSIKNDAVMQLKKTQSPLYQPEEEYSEHESKRSKNNIITSKLSKVKLGASLKSNESLYKSVDDMDRGNSFQSKINQSTIMQREIQKERHLNHKLKEMLLERQNKLKYYQDLQQKEINQSLSTPQDEMGLDFTNLLLGIILCLIIGFFISKFDFSDNL